MWPSQQQPAQPAVPEVTVEERNSRIKDWLAAKATLEAAKNNELELRNILAKMCFPNPVKGTQRIDLGEGYSLKMVHKVNYKIDAEKVEDVLDEIEKVGNEGQFLGERLVKLQYDLSVSEYGKLDVSNPTHKKVKALLDKIVTTTDATPAMEFEVPKPK